METKEYLSVREVAEELGVERKTIYRLILRGDLPAAKVGKAYRIRRGDLDAYFEDQKVHVAARLEEKGREQCGFCGAPLTGPLDVGGHCQECGLPLCISCWSLRGRHFCRNHEEQGPAGTAEGVEGKGRAETVLVCGRCRRVIPGQGSVAGTCQAEGCDEPLCQGCWDQADDRYCLHHRLSPDQKLRRARERLAAGEIPCLVTSTQAKRMELHFIHRFDRKVQAIVRLHNPLTGQVLTDLPWTELRQSQDNEDSLMSLMGVSFLDRDVLVQMPVSPCVRYEVRAPGSRPGPPGSTLILEARVASRLAEYVRNGFDTQPLGLRDLNELLGAYFDAASASEAAHIVGLASPTGWDEQAHDFIASARPGRGFSHSLVMPCLVDLPRMTLTYDEVDSRLKGFVSIFRPLLVAEEVQLAVDDVRQALILSPGTLSLGQICEELPQYDKEVIQQALQELASKGTHVLEELGGVGLVISERE